MKKNYIAPSLELVILPQESLLGPNSIINNTPTDNTGGEAPKRIGGMYI